jgi:hypothetical protein
LGWAPRKRALCYREIDEDSFRAARDLLGHYGESPEAVQAHTDAFDYKWLVVRRSPALYPGLVTDLRAASKVFAANEVAAQLLVALLFFEQAGATSLALIYTYRRGTLYPFAPQAGRTRNHRLEIAMGNALEGHVPLKSDLMRWFPHLGCARAEVLTLSGGCG